MTPHHQSNYSEEQENGGTEPGIVLSEHFSSYQVSGDVIPWGWVTQVGGAVTLDQVSILSAPSSLEINWSMNGLNSQVSDYYLSEGAQVKGDLEPWLGLDNVDTSHLSGRVGGTGKGQLVAVFKSETELLRVIASLNLVIVDIIAVHCTLVTLEGGHWVGCNRVNMSDTGTQMSQNKHCSHSLFTPKQHSPLSLLL